MKDVIRPWRFFRIAPLHSSYMLAGFGGLAALGSVTLVLDSQQAFSALAPVLLLQMFAAASGFVPPARRGHLDLLLTAGSSRLEIGVAHLAMSAAPGVLAWISLAFVELAVTAGAQSAALTSGTGAAFALVSALSWAMTVRLPRLTGGVIWLVSLFVAATAFADWRAVLVGFAEGQRDPWTLSAVFLLCPFVLIGVRLEPSDMWVVVPALALAAGTVGASLDWIRRTDVVLEASQ